MSRQPPRHIVILGGGTAGWMAACLLAQHWSREQVAITLVESPDVGIIGVGEGSTPQLRAFFRKLGIAEADWMPRCHATYKHGIRFNNWSTRPGFESYYHPFATALDSNSQSIFEYNTRARRTGRDVVAHPDRFFLPAVLAQHRLGPIPAERFPFDVSYGYHFDAHLVGEMLGDIAKDMGVIHLQQHVTQVVLAQNGAVDHLMTKDETRIDGDFFIDSSGFQGRILQAAMAEPFRSFANNLFNDRAVVLPTGVDPTGVNPHTTATALSAGWVWDIPLTNRTGNGYVYASDWIDDDAAETELRKHLEMLDSAVSVRHLQMKVGRVERSWVNNCLAIGLAQGFIEPLEATALHIAQTTVEMFIDAIEGDSSPEQFNGDIAARYDGIRDYIVCHYRVNQRTDSEYWRANAANQNLSDNLKAILTTWFTGADLAEEIERLGIAQYYASLSWHCLLAGYGTFPSDAKLQPPGSDIQHHDMAEIDDFIRRCALNFQDHKSLLAA